MADARSKERKALTECWRLHDNFVMSYGRIPGPSPEQESMRAAILDYGRAVREADKETVGIALPNDSGYYARQAISAIEALEKEERSR